ncbi:MAG TPA: hypothetical protein VFT29_00305 [Gemmatimonadaceae bacterium]|nr:hypothetical protein [Gemmatimonadaceae bacterium]
MHDASRAAVRGLVAAVTVLIAFAILTPVRLNAQISPGPLSRAHASLDVPLDCAKCHGGRREPTTQRCLACHREIAAVQQQQRGYHARDGKGACASCHPDHAGRDFALIKWPTGSEKTFDHAATGWTLEGKHREVECASCHKATFRVDAAAALSPRQGGPRWVGLQQRCASCHVDPHRASLGERCASCHDMTGWKPAAKFDHAETRYPLTGRHARVECASCHLAPRLRPRPDSAGKLVPVFRPVPAADCSSCHADPHQGRLTGKCASCHVTTSFRSIERGAFAHERTRFPLVGRHADVACAKCHVGYPRTINRPAFATCGTCHTDPHGGRTTLAGRVVDCAACHRVQGFAPATFTAVQHQATAFPLRGRHAMVRCSDCHRARDIAGARVVADLRPAAATCASCHSNPHGAQLAGRRDAGACESCHDVAGWRPGSFTLAAHAALRLPLQGRHAEITCAACHGPDRRGLRPLPATASLGVARVIMRPPEVTCEACHRNPHGAIASRDTTCATCHDARAFRPSTIDVASHSRFRFALQGAHRTVPCAACHRELERAQVARGAATLVLATLRGSRDTASLGLRAPEGCASCHVTPHGTQFASRPDRGACEACHTVDGFRPAALFDHDRDTKFPLTPAHVRVPCASCHVRPAPVGGQQRPVVYRGTVVRCTQCHAGGRP